jgi:hypothetical protein
MATELFAPVGAQVDEPKLVEEIESLCMNCHENVSCSISHQECRELILVVGNNETSLNQDSLLSRNRHHVIPLRSLRP